jgi:hypothetical protein
MPFSFAFLSSARLLTNSKTWIRHKPLPAYFTGTFFDITGACHDVLLNDSGKQQDVEKGSEEKRKNGWVSKPVR